MVTNVQLTSDSPVVLCYDSEPIGIFSEFSEAFAFARDMEHGRALSWSPLNSLLRPELSGFWIALSEDKGHTYTARVTVDFRK